VRLDHLLSKEHLPAKAGQEPVPPECGGGVLDGGDTGESRPTAATGLEYSRPLVGWWERGCGAVGGGVDTLLGPEGTTAVGLAGWGWVFWVGDPWLVAGRLRVRGAAATGGCGLCVC
jgi:hypothetical protein